MKSEEINISVIVPIYNVEEYLEECLDSLLRQGKVSLEVLMVNDGSTDESVVIAKRYEEEYENFHLYNIPNGGLGHARNYAVPFAVGKYIIFLDSDDVVPDGSYEKMFLLAEKNGSDLTICNVARFNSNKVWVSALHNKLFYNIEPVTHITKNCNLIYDTTSWNKLILRSFYLKHGFLFPEKVLYEDIPVTIPMHCLANQISVMTDIGYLWRVRDGASKSITQNTSDLKNLYDRIKIIKMLDTFFEKNVKDRQLQKKKSSKVLEVDLMIFVKECCTVTSEQALEIMSLINDYIKTSIHPEAFDDLKIIDQQKYQYITEENLSGLLRVLEYEKNYYQTAPIKEDGNLFVELPGELFTVKKRDITKELVKYEPRYYIDGIVVEKNKVKIVSHIYRRRINIREHAQQKISAFLYNELTGNKIPLEVIPEESHALTDFFGTVINPQTEEKTVYNYDGAGFGILIDIEKLEFCEKSFGSNRILVEYENRFSKGHVILGGASYDLKRKYNNYALFLDQNLFQLEFGYLDKLNILLSHETIYKEEVRLESGQIVCKVNDKVDALWAVEKGDRDNIVLFKTDNNIDFHVSADVFEKEKTYHILVDKNNEKVSLLSKAKRTVIQDSGDLILIENTQLTFNLRIALYDFVAMAKMTVEESNDHMIKFAVRTVGNIKGISDGVKARLYIEDWISGQTEILGERECILKDGGIRCTFQVDFGKEEVNRNFYQSTRTLYIEYLLENGELVKLPIYSKRHFKHIVSLENLKISCYRGIEGKIRLKFAQIWKKEEDSYQKRQALTIKNYPLYRQEKINPRQIVFESLWGMKYSCNPQAIYEYINKYYPEYECIWSFRDARTPVKGNAKRVRRGSQEYFYYLATAKYLVNNVNFENAYVKREGQIELQTMHGTPLKTFGLDIESEFQTEHERKQFLERNSRWDYLVVQGEFMKQKGRSCFGFTKEILCTGYPRTDRLFENGEQIKDQIKEKLGLPKDKKVILYAPTWRVKTKFDMQLDLEKMKEALGKEYILLVRIHYFCAKYYTIPADNKFVFDLNSYRYVEELYIISDILITDYSSVMFDYALLQKPMLFFVYDLEEYCEKIRGLYVDFEKEAPGPLLYSTKEVISAILNLEEEMEKCKERIEAFRQKFLTYERPNSTREIVEKVFQSNPVVHFVHKIKNVFAKGDI